MTPTIQEIWRHAPSSGDRGHGLARKETLLDNLQLLFSRPVSVPYLTGDQFNPSVVVSHKPVLEDIPKPPALGRLSGRNGGQFTGAPPARLLEGVLTKSPRDFVEFVNGVGRWRSLEGSIVLMGLELHKLYGRSVRRYCNC